MKVIILCLALAAGLAVTEAATDKIVCYYGSWAVYRSGNGYFNINNIDPTLCTHVLYSFVGATTSGAITFLDPGVQPSDFSSFVGLKSKNPNLKVMLAMGGWNEGSSQYSTIAASASLRSTFATNVINLLNQYGFDGFDLDWEYPAQRGGSSADKANLILLLKELKAKLSPYNKILTMAVAAALDNYGSSYDVPGMNQYLDLFLIMGYDYHSAYDAAVGHHSPLYASAVDTTTASKRLNVDNSITAWINAGATASKVVMGMPFYGRAYTLQSSSNNKIGSAAVGPAAAGSYTGESGFLGYLEICEKLNKGGWTTVIDSNTRTPYSYKGTEWVGYDNPTSIATKASYTVSKGLGGVMVWSIETDDHNNICGSGKFPLLNAIKSVISTGSGSGTTSTTTTTVSSGTSGTTTTTKATTTTTQSSGGSSGCPYNCTEKNVGYFINESDSTKFYYCGMISATTCKRYDFACPSGTVYSTRYSQCMYPSAA